MTRGGQVPCETQAQHQEPPQGEHPGRRHQAMARGRKDCGLHPHPGPSTLGSAGGRGAQAPSSSWTPTPSGWGSGPQLLLPKFMGSAGWAGVREWGGGEGCEALPSWVPLCTCWQSQGTQAPAYPQRAGPQAPASWPCSVVPVTPRGGWRARGTCMGGGGARGRDGWVPESSPLRAGCHL